MLSRLAFWASHPDKKRVFGFKEGNIDDANLLGQKGANLCELYKMGLPVPNGFIITSEACSEFYHSGNIMSEDLLNEYIRHIHQIERKTGRIFGGTDVLTPPLLVSIRSSTSVRCPGLMETILNLGINDEVTQTLAVFTKNPKFAYDTQRRFLQMFGTSVMGVSPDVYDKIVQDITVQKGIAADTNIYLDENDLKNIVTSFKTVAAVPNDVYEQLRMAIEACMSSWYIPSVSRYRTLHDIHETPGVAIIIQEMVYGNLNFKSGVGVAYTRSPVTGVRGICGDDSCSTSLGRTPLDIQYLNKFLPEVHEQLLEVDAKLERSHRDMQEIEVTVESGKLYVLESRSGPRNASVRIAVDMVQENSMTEAQALFRVNPRKLMCFQQLIVDTET
eukprot:gene8833-18295_t